MASKRNQVLNNSGQYLYGLTNNPIFLLHAFLAAIVAVLIAASTAKAQSTLIIGETRVLSVRDNPNEQGVDSDGLSEHRQLGGGLLPPDRNASANWQMAGMLSVGGIPKRTTVCATVRPRGGGNDDTTTIQNAIDACPPDQV